MKISWGEGNSISPHR